MCTETVTETSCLGRLPILIKMQIIDVVFHKAYGSVKIDKTDKMLTSCTQSSPKYLTIFK